MKSSTIRALCSASALLLVLTPHAQAAEPPPSLVGPQPQVSAPLPTQSGLNKALDPLVASAPWREESLVVVDPLTGSTLWQEQANTALIPASTAKLFTAAAALDVLGPNTRLATTVTQQAGVLTLVGGGDATLRKKQLRALAKEAAQKLGSTTSVSLAYDDSLFTGRALGPGWPRSFVTSGVVAPVSALMVNQGKLGGRARSSDPALTAARLFAEFLTKEGITVTSVKKSDAAVGQTIARVESEPIRTIVQTMLTESDNDVAESLGHLIGATAGIGGTFAGGAQATIAALDKQGIDTQGMTLVDASGLSARNEASADQLAQVLTASVRGEPPLWSIISSGLAVAGESGTLEDRFTAKGTKAGRGAVYAKTGTLNGVSSLAGSLRDRDGRVLVFAWVANKVRSLPGARATMDRMASQLVKCGCR